MMVCLRACGLAGTSHINAPQHVLDERRERPFVGDHFRIPTAKGWQPLQRSTIPTPLPCCVHMQALVRGVATRSLRHCSKSHLASRLTHTTTLKQSAGLRLRALAASFPPTLPATTCSATFSTAFSTMAASPLRPSASSSYDEFADLCSKGLLINGEWVQPKERGVVNVVNPATEEIMCKSPAGVCGVAGSEEGVSSSPHTWFA